MAENIDAELAAYEQWLAYEHGLDSEWQPERNCYKNFPAHLAWKAWQAARRTPSASIGEDGLPDLPDGDEYSATRMLQSGQLAPRYTAATMRQYARDAVAADRRAREPMTYDEFFAEAARLGCKLPPEMLLPHRPDEESPQAAQGVKREQQLEEVVRSGVDDLMRIHAALGLDADAVIDADVMIEQIERLRTLGTPDGWALVPLEPTPEMVAAMHFKGDVDVAIGHARFYKDAVEDYGAMLEAAPAPPLSSEQQSEKGEK